MDKVQEFTRDLDVTSDRMKKNDWTRRQTEIEFQSGDAIWLNQPQRKKRNCPKLKAAIERSYLTTKRINDLVFHIQLNPKSKPMVVHVARLASYAGPVPLNSYIWGIVTCYLLNNI